ncbi:MAG TPA: acetyltransferase [Roseiarcus sp.]|jgi:sugar O-acyltransferase (sialic acid O-acetyltransferase NeuD family)|nr:acetyltransferase [Roseiarcus sp.]
MSARLLLLGAGGHGKVAADCAAAQKAWSGIEFYDDRWPSLSTCADWPVVGAGADLVGRERSACQAFVAIGDADTRLAWIGRLREAGFDLATIVHPRAIVSARAFIGPGGLVVAGAVVNIGTRLEEGVIVNTAATIDHDCAIGPGAHICPGAHLAGNVEVGRGARIGVGAAVREGVKIGAGAVIGAGAAVIDDIAAGVKAYGVPARPAKARTEDGR